MLGFYLRHFRLLRLSGITIPFVIETSLKCKVPSSAKVKLDSRLRFGNKKLISVSAQKANFQLGKNSSAHFGKSISIGPGVNIIVKDGAKITVGNNTYFTSDSHIESTTEISIGSDCAISWGVTIIDDDHHDLLYNGKKQSSPGVLIGNNVWIGCNATILKGTQIGDGSVIAAGSVVRGIYGKNCLVAGNPARVIRENIEWR